MAHGTLKLGLEGEVFLGDFRKVVAAWSALIDEITDEVAPGGGIEWEITESRGGSFHVTIEGRAEGEAGRNAIPAVVSRYERTRDYITTGKAQDLSRREITLLREMSSVIDGRVRAINLEADDERWTIEAPLSLPVQTIADSIRRKPLERTSARGKIVLISYRARRYFTLEEAHTNTSINCYWNDSGLDARVFDSSQNRVWVLVSGLLNSQRDPKVISDITSIEPFPNIEPEAWRLAVGCNPPPDSGEHDPGHEIIRRLRGDGDD